MSNNKQFYKGINGILPGEIHLDDDSVNDFAGVKYGAASISEKDTLIANLTRDIENNSRITRMTVPSLSYGAMIELGTYQLSLSGTNSDQNIDVFARQVQNVLENEGLVAKTGYVNGDGSLNQIKTSHQKPICSIDHLVKNTFELNFLDSADPENMYDSFVSVLNRYKK